MFLQRLNLAFRALLVDHPALITIIGGVLFYAALYPQPYLNNLPSEQAITLVDFDRTSDSRQLARWIDAAPGVAISHQADSISEARELLVTGNASGIVVIPRHFMRDRLLGRSPTLSLSGDANYFLVYGSVIESAAQAMEALLEIDPTQAPPVEMNLAPLFNPSMGYLGYVIPAVFILILHQTLLLAAGLLGAGLNEKNSLTGLTSKQLIIDLAARFVCLFSVYMVLGMLYLGVCFEFYGIERHAQPLDLLRMLAAFTAATTALGLLLGAVLPGREWAAPIVMTSSLPLVFSAGFVWPSEAIPGWIALVSSIFPSTQGIPGFLSLNQMGASLDEVHGSLLRLWALAALYGFSTAALLVHRYSNRRFDRLGASGAIPS